MTTFYMDFVGGNDSNDGTTFANRWKTFTNGALASRTAPGDTIRVMRSPQPTLVDSGASWTNGSPTITLSGAVTLTIDNCETAWTASANVTSTRSSTYYRQGTYGSQNVIASGFTTGKASYFATGTLDLSAYQQVSFWVRVSAAVADGSTLSLRLCTDTAGATSVHTIPIPAIAVTSSWTAVVVDLGTNMNSAIASIALYADKDPGTITVILDNIIACKASSSADALTHHSLIGKARNLPWVGSTSYAQYDIVKPTPPNRNGFVYRKTDSGSDTSGGSEPTWPTVIGQTVSDSTITWECYDLEETWIAIRNIDGTSVRIDGAPQDTGSSSYCRAYAGTTETAALYKREPIVLRPANATTGCAGESQESGSEAGGKITYSGGWDTTDMSTMDGETWVTATGFGYCYHNSGLWNTKYVNLSGVRATYAFYIGATSFATLEHCHFVSCQYGLRSTTSTGRLSLLGVTCSYCSYPIQLDVTWSGKRIRVDGADYVGISRNGTTYMNMVTLDVAYLRSNWNAGFDTNMAINFSASNVVTSGNGGGVSPNQAIFYGSGNFTGQSLQFNNCLFAESKINSNADMLGGVRYHFTKYGQTADDHRVYFGETCYAKTQTTTRHTASGLAWQFVWLYDTYGPYMGSALTNRLSVAKLLCAANTAKTVTIWTRRDSTSILGKLRVRGGQLLGVPDDVEVACEPSVNTWTQSSNLTFTPTETGVIEVEFLVWGIGSSGPYNYYIDDLAVS